MIQPKRLVVRRGLDDTRMNIGQRPRLLVDMARQSRSASP